MNSFNDKFIVYTGPTFPLLNKDHALHLQFVLHHWYMHTTMRIHAYVFSGILYIYKVFHILKT